MLYRGKPKRNNINKRDTPNERVLFERLWKGTFQAVFAERSSKFRRELEAQNSKTVERHNNYNPTNTLATHVDSKDLPSYGCMSTTATVENRQNIQSSNTYFPNMNRGEAVECNHSCVSSDLRNLLSRMRRPCCCHCSCVTHDLHSAQDINNLQVYLTNDSQPKAVRSVIRYQLVIYVNEY